MSSSTPQPDAPRPKATKEIPLGPTGSDDAPYAVVGGDERKCPGCGKALAPEAKTCAVCGCDLQTGKKPVKTYPIVERHWQAGLPYPTRLRLFWAGQVLAVLPGLLGAVWGGYLITFFLSWTLFTGLMAFLLGTYDRLDLLRNKKGRVFLTKTWRVCFLWDYPAKIAVAEHEGLATRGTCEPDGWDWAILIILLVAGGVPGIVWWYVSMNRVTYQVALTKDHGYPAVLLYRGWDESLMKDIAQTIHEVAELPYQST